jgi:hypothetical protein
MAEFELPEKAESRHERVVGLIIAAIAVVLAIVSSIGHSTQNEQILAHVDASDQYAFYQAKRERFLALELSADNLSVYADRLSPAGAAKEAQLAVKYLKEQQRLGDESREIQAKGDDLMKEATRLGRKAHVLDVGEIALQISIVLCSITILTEQRLFAIMGVITAGVGVAVALWGIVLG